MIDYAGIKIITFSDRGLSSDRYGSASFKQSDELENRQDLKVKLLKKRVYGNEQYMSQGQIHVGATPVHRVRFSSIAATYTSFQPKKKRRIR
jgi:hypothetical protein